jgi:hypothetical protein
MDIPQIPSIPRNSPAQIALSGEFFLERQPPAKILNINDMRAFKDLFLTPAFAPSKNARLA